jgi:hypothetical protein
MSEPLRPLEIRFRDPLSEVTRKERTALLAVSAVAIVISTTGLIPTKISALGIEFGNSDQAALLFVLQCIVGFFICAFLFYASFDFVAWRVMWHDSVWNTYLSESQIPPENRQTDANKVAIQMVDLNIKWWRISTPVINLRYAFEFFIPLLVSVIALFCLHSAKAKIKLSPATTSSNSIQRPNQSFNSDAASTGKSLPPTK